MREMKKRNRKITMREPVVIDLADIPIGWRLEDVIDLYHKTGHMFIEKTYTIYEDILNQLYQRGMVNQAEELKKIL